MRSESRNIEAKDGTSLHIDIWMPEGAPKRVVVVAHGGAEHAGRYARLAADLVLEGALVFGPDHRGFGRSGGTRGHITSFSDYAADLRQVMRDVASREAKEAPPASVPWFLYGHSMGGLIALTYLLDEQHSEPKLRGAIISSPLLGLTMKVNPLKLLIGKLAGKIAPKLALPSGIPADAICRDQEEVARYTADKLRVDVVTAGWFSAMNGAIARVESDASTIELPMLWYVGTGDRVCDHIAAKHVFDSLRKAHDRDQTLREFDGYYHELHNEPTELRAPVIAMIREWLVKHD
jgi:alpha-beta hydrolase superfamily lysophospholipase